MVKYVNFVLFHFFSRAKEKLQDTELQGQQLRVSDILDKILVTLPRSEVIIHRQGMIGHKYHHTYNHDPVKQLVAKP